MFKFTNRFLVPAPVPSRFPVPFGPDKFYKFVCLKRLFWGLTLSGQPRPWARSGDHFALLKIKCSSGFEPSFVQKYQAYARTVYNKMLSNVRKHTVVKIINLQIQVFSSMCIMLIMADSSGASRTVALSKCLLFVICCPKCCLFVENLLLTDHKGKRHCF